MLKRFYLSLFFGRLFYLLLAIEIGMFMLSYGVPFFFRIAQLGLVVLLLILVLDWLILFFRRDPVVTERILPEHFSNGDQNPVKIRMVNQNPFRVQIFLIDEIPEQFQLRDFILKHSLNSWEEKLIEYKLRPVQRGEYLFHDLNIFIKSPLKLVVRRKKIRAATIVKVLPSFLMLRKFELQAYASNLAESGNKRMRKIGHSLEFEQIKDYVLGDDIRSINWKASARKGQLMVNKFADERSQHIYCIIDKSRVMKMPFEGMTLLDYAINASLTLLHVALIKQDRAGLISFSDQIDNFLPADRKAKQINYIQELLYNQQTRFPEADFESLYSFTRTRASQRSLMILFTNFESLSALQRQLPYLKAIARNNLLLIVFFENTGLKQLTIQEAQNIETVYMKTIAEKFVFEKKLMVRELMQHGIPAILTSPRQLTVDVLNKYLEIKARQEI